MNIGSSCETVTESTREAIRLAKERTAIQISESGAYLAKSGIGTVSDPYQALFDVAVFHLMKKTPDPDVIGALTLKNNQLKTDAYPLEVLQAVKRQAHEFLNWFELVKEQTETPETTFNPIPHQYSTKAQGIIQSGTVLHHFRETFKTLHSGNLEICDIITLAGTCGSNLTSRGIQPGFSGQMGTGKTTGTRAALHLWPEEYLVDGGLSNKALFYDESLKPGCVIFSDDTYLNEELLQTVKSAMSSFQAGAAYRTVGKGPNGTNIGIKKHIPPRSTFIFTSIDDAGDQELSDRQYKLSLSPGDAEKKARLSFLQGLMENGREELPLSENVLICRDIFRDIKSKIFKVKIPFAKNLHFLDTDNMRDIVQFFDFIQSVAILNYPNRNPVIEDGVTVIKATKEDFNTALKIFKTSEDIRKYKITKNERALIDWMCEKNQDGIPESEIVSEFGQTHKITRGTVRRILYGRDGNGGLCNKVPGIYLQKERISKLTDSDSKIQANVIYCNSDLKSNLGNYQAFVEYQEETTDNKTIDPDHQEAGE